MLLSDLRAAAGKTQTAVADELGISPSTVKRHEQGKTALTGMHRRAYADFYGVQPEQVEQPEWVTA